MRAVLAIAIKDLRVLSRHRLALFWVLVFPFLMALFFGAIFSGGGGPQAMRIAIADEDHSDFSRKFAETLRRSEALRVVEMPVDSARVLVRQGRLVAYVLLPTGMGDTFGFGRGDSAGGLEVGIDPSRRAEQGYLRGLLTQAVFTAMQGQFSAGGGGRDAIRRSIARVRTDSRRSPGERARTENLFDKLDAFMTALDSSRTEATGDSTSAASGFGGPAIRMVPIAEADDRPRSGFEITFPSSVFWALIGVCSSFAISIVSERTRGTFLRLRLAPISRAQVLAGKGLACFVAGLGVTTLLMAFAAAAFHVRVSNPPALAAALLASTLCFVGLMMLISTLGRDERAVSGAGWAILLMQSMIGGGMIPLIAMPPWLQTLSHFSVVKWGVLAVEGAVWRGFSWAEMAPPLGILLAVGAVGFVVGAANLSRSDT